MRAASRCVAVRRGLATQPPYRRRVCLSRISAAIKHPGEGPNVKYVPGPKNYENKTKKNQREKLAVCLNFEFDGCTLEIEPET